MIHGSLHVNTRRKRCCTLHGASDPGRRGFETTGYPIDALPPARLRLERQFLLTTIRDLTPMHAELLDPYATLYAQPAPDARVVRQITQGSDLDLDPPADPSALWYTVHLPDGNTAYLPGDTNLLPYRLITLAADTDVYAEPRREAPGVYRFARHATLMDISDRFDNQGWTRVRDGQGEVGFLPPESIFVEPEVRTPQQRLDAERIKKAKYRIRTGGTLLVIASMIIFLNYHFDYWSAQPDPAAGAPFSRISIEVWGLMLFGGIRFLLGLGGWIIYSVEDLEEGDAGLA